MASALYGTVAKLEMLLQIRRARFYCVIGEMQKCVKGMCMCCIIYMNLSYIL